MKKYLFLILLGCLFASNAHAAITFDTSSTAAFASNISHTNITVGSGSNELLVIEDDCGLGNGTHHDVKVDNVAPTFIASSTNGSSRYSWIFYMVGVSAGSHSVTSTAGSCLGSMVVSSYFGVNQSTPLDTFATSSWTNSQGTPYSTNITTNVANDLLTDSWGTNSTGWSAGSGQSVLFSGTGNSGQSSYKLATTAGSYTMSWAFTGSNSGGSSMVAAFEPASSLLSHQKSIQNSFAQTK